MPFFILNAGGIQEVPGRQLEQVPSTQEPSNGKSYLGTPVYSFVEFSEGSYVRLSGERISYDGVRLETVLLTISQTKNIVVTSIQGKDGTIKEYVSDGDYIITITGKVVNQNNEFPEIALNALKEICKVPDTLAISCPFLEAFDVTGGVITDYNFNELEGFRDTVDFTLNILSDPGPLKQGNDLPTQTQTDERPEDFGFSQATQTQ